MPCTLLGNNIIDFKYTVFGGPTPQDSHSQFSAKNSTYPNDKTPVYEIGKIIILQLLNQNFKRLKINK